MSYEFQSTLFDSKSEYIASICEEWLSAGGENDAAEIMEAYSDFSDAELVAELHDGFGAFDDVSDEELKEQFAEMRRAAWTNTNIDGREVNYQAAVELMDSTIREALHTEMAPCKDQAFLDAYLDAHKEKFGESFTV